jgi:hypothetical protein
MVYKKDTPNTTEWQVGDLVIGPVDRERPFMLMRVTKVDPIADEYTTRYLFPSLSGGGATRDYVNQKRSLWGAGLWMRLTTYNLSDADLLTINPRDIHLPHEGLFADFFKDRV